MPTVDTLIAEARELDARGRPDEAEQLFRQALEQEPENGEVHFLLGCSCFRTGKPDQAVSALREAARLAPTYAEPLVALGNVLISLRSWNEAVDALSEARTLRPDLIPLKLSLGFALVSAGRTAEAENVYLDLLAADPAHLEARNNLAHVLNERRRYTEGEAHARIAVGVAPESLAALSNHAVSLYGLGRFQEAEAVCRRAVAIDPNAHYVHVILFNALLAQQRRAEAETVIRRALELQPNDAGILDSLGLILMDLERWDEAISALQRAVELEPGSAVIARRLSMAHGHRRDLEEAEWYARVALELEPNNPDTINNFGVRLMDLGRVDEAIERFEQALGSETPAAYSFTWYHWNAHLMKGDYARGFPIYERWMTESNFKRRDFPLPRWDGNAMPGRTLLVYADHGFGDAIQMLRFLPAARERSRADILFEAPPELVPLVANDPNVKTVVERAPDGRPLDIGYDAVIGLMSLAGVCCPSVDAIPRSVPYVYPANERLVHWRERLQERTDFRIGVCWTGDPGAKLNPLRSCRLADFAAISSIPGVKLFSLQVGFGADQSMVPPEGMSLVDLGPELTDFGETAAALANMDAVITIETAAAHLAGALGLLTYVPLTKPSSWIWMLDREDSPWYPTLKVVRQTERGDWTSVFERIEQEIRCRSRLP